MKSGFLEGLFMERTTLDLWVGLFVVAGIAALVMLAMKVGNLGTYNVSETYQVHAYFSNIGGLKPKASIKSAGVLVGRVTDITLDTERYEANVVMSLDKRYQFPKDTFASVLTSGLLGEQYIGLNPGGDSEMIHNGDEIKKTQSAVVLEDLIGKFIYNKAEEPVKLK
jgi:phospholipid/cholesterol/gamma-HCH transport system substrate-binding protein